MVVGGGGQPNAVRTSDTAWLENDDPVVNKIIKKAAELTGVATSNIEHLQVVRYKPGTFYKEHHDSCCDPTDSCLDFEKRGGQRIGTLLVYLNSDFTDGETHFPKWNGGVKLKADPGSAIFFRPMATNSAQCHPQALHAGLPISSGTKYVCNAWVRERAL
jgi:prolyl 4-hydroxylase